MTAVIPPGRAARAAARLAALVAPLVLAAGVQAAPVYLVDATTDGNAPDPGFGNVAFSLTYEDHDGDMAFALSELLAFTGISDGNGQYFSDLLAVPVLPGIAGSGTDWVFGDGAGGDWRVAASAFTPFTSGPLPGSVPAPGTLPLVGLALAGLAVPALRRRPQAVARPA